MKYTLISLLFLLTGMFTATGQDAKVAEGPEMTFENLVFEFGDIQQGETASYVFKFTNTGTQPIIISSANGSCGCTVPEWPKEPIMKGSSGEIRVSFNSEGKLGVQDKTVTLTSNAVNSPIVLHMKGNVTRPRAVSDDSRPAEKAAE